MKTLTKTALLSALAQAPHRFGAKDDGQPSTDLLVKASHGMLELKAEGADGEISGYGSVFDKVDSYGETVIAGAFAKSLKRWKSSNRPIPMLWQHRSDMPIGVWTDFEEDGRGLKMAGQLNLATQRGADAWSDVKMKAVGGLSIGYYEIKADPWDFGATEPRKLIELDLRETSVVTFPALKEARIDAVKARLARGERLTLREFEVMLREKLRLSRSDAEEIAALGYQTWIQRDVGTGDGVPELAQEIRALRSLPALDLPTF